MVVLTIEGIRYVVVGLFDGRHFIFIFVKLSSLAALQFGFSVKKAVPSPKSYHLFQ